MNDIQPGPTRDHSTYIGSSDISAIAGQNPFRSGLDVWAEKHKKAPAFEGNMATDIGTAFERPALELYAKHSGANLTYPGTLMHPAYPWAGATPDAIRDGRFVAECKIVGFNSARFWGAVEDGPDAIPAHVLIQTHWQSWIVRTLNLAPCHVAEVPAFFGTEMRIYEVPIDEVMIEGLKDIANEFWTQHIEKDVMPEITGDSAKDLMQAMHPRHTKILLEPMTGEVVELAHEYRDARDAVSAAKSEQNRIAAELEARIGDNTGFEGNGVKVTWKNPKGSPSWKTIAERLGARIDRHIYDATIREHTPEEGTRRLNVNIK